MSDRDAHDEIAYSMLHVFSIETQEYRLAKLLRRLSELIHLERDAVTCANEVLLWRWGVPAAEAARRVKAQFDPSTRAKGE